MQTQAVPVTGEGIIGRSSELAQLWNKLENLVARYVNVSL